MKGADVRPPAGRIAVSGICSIRQSLQEDLALWHRHGVRSVGIPARKLGAGDAQRVADAGLRVTSVITLGPRLDEPDTWNQFGDHFHDVFGAAKTMDAGFVALTTGAAGPMEWPEATATFVGLLGPLLAEAPGPVLLEHTNQLRFDISFVFRLADALDVAQQAGVGVLMEITACWNERGLAGTLERGGGTLGLVQLSDLGPVVLSTPNRLVPGDGVIPMVRIITQLSKAGYRGDFELEYCGPAIEEEGYDDALRRALAATDDIILQAQGAAHG